MGQRICDKCHLLCGELCPKCRSSRHLREPQADEPVLLMVLTAIQALPVDPILEESKIPYFRKGMIGGALAMQAGALREIYSYYVPCSACTQARALIEEVFVEDEAIMRALHEFDAPEENKA